MKKRIALLPWLAVASLSLNVFLGTVLFLHGPRHRHHPPGPPNPMEIAEHMGRGLPAGDAAILRKTFLAHAGEFQALRSKAEAFPQRLRAVLEVEPFDAKAAHAVMMEGIEGHSSFDRLLATALTEALSAMSSEGRRKFAEHPLPGGPMPPPPDDHPPPDDEPPPPR